MDRVTAQEDTPAVELDMGKLLAARRLAVAACPYLASALHAMAVVPSSSVLTMAVDRYWRCYVSPFFVAATDVRDLAVVWLHEVSHLIRDHHRRAQQLLARSAKQADSGSAPLDHKHPLRAQLCLNLAMDCEINDDLLQGVTDAGGRALRLPDGAVTPELLQLPRRSLFEQYVKDLPLTGPNGYAAWLDCGSGAHAGDSPWEHDGTDAHPLGEYEAAAIRIKVREAVGRTPGTIPAGWRRWAEGIAEPSQDWRVLPGGAFRACLAAGSGAGDYTYQRPSRRTSSLGGTVVLPSLRRPVPHVAVVVDTSGSVTDEDLGSALSEVAGISRAVGVSGERVSVYSCDAAVHTVQRICAAQEISLVGGGGTDLRRGISRAISASPRPDVVVVLTDGGTPWPSAPPGARVVAGIFGSVPRYSERGGRTGVHAPEWAQTVYLR
jgi:predicted metal-dependent peptidase